MVQKYYISLKSGIQSHLDGAYSIKINRLFSRQVDFVSLKEDGWERIDVYDILTNKGGLHISLNQTHTVSNKSVVAYIKSSLSEVPNNEIIELVNMVISAEVFLTYDNYIDYKIEVFNK